MITLKSCPFCGGKPFIEDSQRGFIDGKITKVCFIRCSVCNARSERVNVKDYGKSSRSIEAINHVAESWNKRDRFVTEYVMQTYIDKVLEHKNQLEEAARQAAPIATTETETNEITDTQT